MVSVLLDSKLLQTLPTLEQLKDIQEMLARQCTVTKRIYRVHLPRRDCE